MARNPLSLIRNSDRIDECMRIYAEHHLDGVAITTSHDYSLQNVDFLAKYPQSLSLYNYNPKSKDCLSISNAPWVKSL
jgi:hypothetical protein